MKKIAVILSGCGHKDGTEITEAISTLIALSELGVHYQCFAPNTFVKSINHLTGQAQEESRNLLVESARISRGQSQDLELLNPNDYDAVIFPGGYGAATNLSNWAEAGHKCQVLPSVENAIRGFYKEGKPIGAICISPVVIARVLGKEGITVTIGNDPNTAKEIEKTGAIHESCPVEDFITDRHHKVISTPAYMYDANPHKVFQGITGLVRELVEMA